MNMRNEEQDKHEEYEGVTKEKHEENDEHEEYEEHKD